MAQVNQKTTGLYDKFEISRRGRDRPGGNRQGAEYVVLDLTHDRHALPALRSYRDAAAGEYPLLAEGLAGRIAAMEDEAR